MYHLNVCLIGCAGDLLQLLRMELSVHGARIEAEYLGVESTVAALRPANAGADPANWNGRKSEPIPDSARRLFIVHVESMQELPAIKRLNAFFPGNPILVLLPSTGDPNLLISAMRMGATQVVMLPLQANDFKSALDCIALQNGQTVTNQVIAVAGVTGGCGATTIAINLAYELSEASQLRVILAELSLQMGKLPLYLNVEPRYTTHDLLQDIHKMDLYFMQQALTPIVERVQILSGPYQNVTPLSVPPSDVLLLVEGLRQLADIVVLDVPCTYDAMYFETLMAADQVVLVAEQKVPSIRSLQMIHGQLQDKLHHLVLNRYDPNVPGFGVDRLRTMLGVSEILTIVSDYPSVMSAVNQGLPLKLKEPKSKVLTGITALAQKLLPRPTEMEETKKPSSMFGRLISTLGIKK